MKRKVFASVLSALMVTSSVSGVLMADSNEEASVSEEAEVVIEESSEEQSIEDAEIEIEETIKDDEVIQEDLAEEDVLDIEDTDEVEAEDIVFDETEESDEELVAPVYEEYEIPGTDTLASTTTLKLGDKATGYLYDEDNDGEYEKLVIKGTGNLYDLTANRAEFAYVSEVSIEEGITSIGDNMFAGCRYLEEVNFPSTLTKIGANAFKNCNLRKEITIPGKVKTIGDSAFEACGRISKVYIKEGTLTIGKNAFKECTFVTEIVLPNTVTSIGEHAFEYCSKLVKINIPTKVSEIPDCCFNGCIDLAINVDLKGVKKIGDSAFNKCYDITSIKLYEGLEYIGESAFGHVGIKNIYLPDSLTYLGEDVFRQARIESIVIPKNITTIPDFLFADCFYLKNVTFASELTEIGKCSFGGCKRLETLVIPETVTRINDYAFTTASIKNLIFRGDNVTFGETILFSGTIGELTIPCNLVDALKKSSSSVTFVKTNLTHSYDHSSDTKCNYCGATREVHLVTMDQFVERLYTTCLGRKSEAAGKEYWIKKLVNGTTGAEAAHQFFFSSEFTSKKLSDKEFVTRLYKTFMDRNPDTAGMDYWLGRIKAGYTREKVFQGFINSQEWADMCLQYGILSGGTKTSTESKEPSKGCVDFATRLYTTCLGRKPDEAGLKDWVMKLARLKTTGTKAAHGFFFSKEFTSKNYSNEEYIKRLYRTFMGREADQGGINYWLGKIKSGYTREDVFQGFAKSAEFEKICIQYGILK